MTSKKDILEVVDRAISALQDLRREIVQDIIPEKEFEKIIKELEKD